MTKVFPGTRVLDQVQLQVQPGEAHALCGENGAGKSTLMNITGDMFPPTEGEILFEGAPITPRSPKEAQDIGIGFVHQELSLYPRLTAAENIFIGRLSHKGGMIDLKHFWVDVDMVLKQFSASFPSSAPVSELTVSEQQIVEIAESALLNCKPLILDESTFSLTRKETARLSDLVKESSGRGISILYISHRMAEIFEICDRVTVFKDGTYATTTDTGDICADDITRVMAGRELGNFYPTKSSCIAVDNPVLEVSSLTGSIFREVSFTLRRGEILGFAGLVGVGWSEAVRGLCAIDPIRSGQAVLNGKPCALHTYYDAVGAGICYLTEDRKVQGLFPEMSIENNIPSANMKGVSHGTWLDDKLERSLTNRFIEQLAVKIPGIEYPISSLSGGNQQKCLIGKWFSLAPKVIIMDEPTRGIDVGAKREIRVLLCRLVRSGVGVIVVSSELPEIIGVSDRVAVMYGGCLADFLGGEEVTGENIMKFVSGEQLAEKEL